MLIYLCEDSKSDLMSLNHHLSAFSKEKLFQYNAVSFSAGEALLAHYRQGTQQPDLIFLDIYMDGKNGMDTARQLRDMGYSGGIIFTSASTEHTMDSYEVNALYYLQKPYTHCDFIKAMERCGAIFEKSRQNFTFTIRRRQLTIPYSDIVFFETGRHTVILHTRTDSISFTGSLSRIAEELNPIDSFLPVGRSYLINLNHVTGQVENDLTMSDGSIVQIPIKKQSEILSAIKQWRK